MKIALLVSMACNSSITGSNCFRNASHCSSQPAGRSAVTPPDGDVAVGQPGPAGRLEQVEDPLPLAEDSTVNGVKLPRSSP